MSRGREAVQRFGFGDDPADLCKFANGADRAAKAAGLPLMPPT